MSPVSTNTPEADAAVCREAVHRLAQFLYVEGRRESVRTREALAAVIGNQVRRLLPAQLAAAARGVPAETIRAGGFLSRLDALLTRGTERPMPDDPVFASCLRIARRAFSGALRDPTRGATGFRKLGEAPTDAPGTDPEIWIGPYVFFAETDTHPSLQPATTAVETAV